MHGDIAGCVCSWQNLQLLHSYHAPRFHNKHMLTFVVHLPMGLVIYACLSAGIIC